MRLVMSALVSCPRTPGAHRKRLRLIGTRRRSAAAARVKQRFGTEETSAFAQLFR